MPERLSELLALLQLGTNVLSAPARIQQSNAQGQLQRAFLQNNASLFGLSPDQINTYAPEPNAPGPLSTAINKGLGGVPGKIFGGVGEVGAILSSLLGGPVVSDAPRLPLSSLTSMANLKATGEYRSALEKEKALGREERVRHDVVMESQGARRGDIAQERADKATAGKDPTPKEPYGFYQYKQDHPGATYDQWKTHEAALAAHAAKKKAAATESTKPIPAAAQKTLSQIETLDGLAGEMLAALDDPAVQANTGIARERLAAVLYRAGIAQPGEDPFLALQAQVRILGTQPYLSGNRGGLTYIHMIQEHLPKPGQEESLKRDQIAQLQKLTKRLHRATLHYASMTKGGARRELQQDQGDQTPSQGTTPSGNTFRVLDQ